VIEDFFLHDLEGYCSMWERYVRCRSRGARILLPIAINIALLQSYRIISPRQSINRFH
jgi:hypothetical protein